MSDDTNKINQHYGQDDLSSKILAALQAAGRNIDSLNQGDLAAFDQLHLGGLSETRNLARMIPDLPPGARVLDVGSGLGGPARTLAAEFGCQVVGLDLTEEFCRAAEMLTERVGLQNQVAFRQGDATHMPFEDNTFDVVWTQFAGMNMRDKERLYAEIQRVLRAGGYFAIHEVMAGTVPEPYFPVLWASEPSFSFLRPPEEILSLLAANHFQQIVWKDLTQFSADWLQRANSAPLGGEQPRLSVNTAFGNDTRIRASNIVRNLTEGRVVVKQGIFVLNKGRV